MQPNQISNLNVWTKADTEVYADGAVQFTASDKAYLVNATSSLFPGTSDYSYSFWINPTTANTVAEIAFTGSANGWHCYLEANGAMTIIHGDNSYVVATSAAGTVTVDSWQNYTIVANRAGNLYVYKNGNTASPVITLNISTITGNVSVGNLRVGGSASGANFNGSMDSFGWWNKALSAAEVASLYNSGAGKLYSTLTATELTNLVSWYDFNEESGTRYDAKGTNHLTSAFANIIDTTSTLGTELVINGNFEDTFAEKVTNGGFDSDTSGWTTSSGTGVSTAGGLSGNALLQTNGANSNCYTYQAITTVIGYTYNFSLWHKNGTSAVGTLNIGNSIGSNTLFSQAWNDAAGATKTGSFVATATTTYLTFYVGTSTTNDTCYWDSVSVAMAGWNPNNGTIASVAGGQSGNCLEITNGTDVEAFCTQTITTVANQNYTFSGYFKNGTAGSGFILIGTTPTGSQYLSAPVNNANWTLYTFTFKATTTSTSISLWAGGVTTGRTSLFDTISLKALTQTNLNGGFESQGAGETLGSELLSNTGFETSGTNGGLISGTLTSTRARTSNVATIVTGTAHGLVSTNVATITGMTDTTFNASNVTVTRIDDTTFTYANTGDDVGSGADTGGVVTTDVFGTWAESVSGGLLTRATDSVKSGTYSAKISSVAGIASCIYQNIVTTASTRYKLTFWTRGDASVAGRYRIYNNTGAAYILDETTTGVTSATWTQVTRYFTTPAGCISVGVYLDAPGSAGIAYFDDVSLKQVTSYDLFLNWYLVQGGLSTINVETTAPYAGTYAVRIDQGADDAFSYITQSVQTSGHKYFISTYAKANSGTPTVLVNAGVVQWTMTTSYALYSGYYTATSASLVIQRGSSASKSLYLDNVTLICTEIPSGAGIAAGLATDGNLAASFNGTTQYLTKASNASLQGNGAYTLFGWVNPTTFSSQDVIISKGTVDGGVSGYEYAVFLAAGVINFRCSEGSTSGSTISGATLPVNSWSFFIAYYDGTKASVSINNNAFAVSAQTATQWQSTFAYMIGASSNGTHFFPGRIDGVGKIGRALTAGEITALYNNGKGVKYAGLPSTISSDATLSFWNLDEYSGGTANVTRLDSTANDNDLTSVGNTPSGQGVNYYEGSVGKWIDQSGNANNLIQVTQANKLLYLTNQQNGKPVLQGDGLTKSIYNAADLIGTGDVTVFAVVKPRTLGGGSVGSIVVNSKFILQIGGTNAFRAYSDNVTMATSANNAFTLGTSVILIVTRTSAGVTNFYVNGTLSGTANQSSGTPAAGTPTYIGNGGSATTGFDGNIMELGVYKKILNATEIELLNNYLTNGVLVNSSFNSDITGYIGI